MKSENETQTPSPRILTEKYGIESSSLEFLREGGSRTYIVNGKNKYLLKVISSAFSDTARQSVSIMRYLEGNGFPVPKTILTKNGEAIFETEDDGEKKLIVLMEFIDGEEPELEKYASEVGGLVGRFHQLMEGYPEESMSKGREFFIGRYLEFLRKKNYPRIAEYEKLGECLWDKVKDLPQGICHGDLHRGNLLQNAGGQIFLVDFDTACHAPFMFDVMVMCDMTDYFMLKHEDMELTKEVYQKFLSGYSGYHKLSREEILSFPYWVAIRHFQLQATILEIYGIDCIDNDFIDGQLYWLTKWQEATEKLFKTATRKHLASVAKGMAQMPFHGFEEGNESNLEEMIQPFPGWTLEEADGLWCAAFVYYCCIKAGFDIPIRPDECRTCHLAGCIAWEEFAIGDSRIEYHTRKDGFVPEAGDIVLYDHVFDDHEHDHIGIIIEKRDGFLLVAEGNVNNRSGIMERPVDEHIRAYIRIPDGYQYGTE